MGPCVQNFHSRGCCIRGCKSPKAGGKKWKKKPKKVILTSWEIQSIKLIQSGKEEHEGCWNQIFFPRVYCAEGAKTIFCYSDFHARSRFFKDPLKLLKPMEKKSACLLPLNIVKNVCKMIIFKTGSNGFTTFCAFLLSLLTI